MGVIFAWPSELKTIDSGLALTFIIPAEKCNLRCAFCAIAQRKEAESSVLRPSDYAHFLSDVAARGKLAIMSIQGYEPLLDESWSYTREILATALRLGVPSSLVTNGILLKKRARELTELRPMGVTVSLDSADSVAHDKSRGVVGAFDQTIDGLEELSSMPEYKNKITVSSVLKPRRSRELEGMPELLASFGIRNWVVNPLLRIGKNDLGGCVDSNEQVLADLSLLHRIAKENGVRVTLDDELRALDTSSIAFNDFVIRRFERPEGLLRLTPSGACSIGGEIMRQVHSGTPIWNPAKVRPYDFVTAIMEEHIQQSELA